MLFFNVSSLFASCGQSVQWLEAHQRMMVMRPNYLIALDFLKGMHSVNINGVTYWVIIFSYLIWFRVEILLTTSIYQNMEKSRLLAFIGALSFFSHSRSILAEGLSLFHFLLFREFGKPEYAVFNISNTSPTHSIPLISIRTSLFSLFFKSTNVRV